MSAASSRNAGPRVQPDTSAATVAAALPSLRVGGLTPLSATDFPEHLSAVVFCQGCPWRCGYCHNPHLQPTTAAEGMGWRQVMSFLERRVGLLDAVVFSGGEPTAQVALVPAVREVRGLGFKVGLHTAGIQPRRLEKVLPHVNWVGLDIKAPLAHYSKITGIPASGDPAWNSLTLLLLSGVDYEVRTTVHPDLLPAAQLKELARSLAGLGVRNFALQEFRSQGSGMEHPELPTPLSDRLCSGVGALFPRFTLRRAH